MAISEKVAYHQLIPKRDIIVIGTSGGGAAALVEFVSGLPGALPASLFVVMHMAPSACSVLPDVLRWRGDMTVLNPKPNSTIERNRIYVAPPDYHLVIERDERISLWHGPKEKNFRPAINPLFRSAAS